MEENKTPFTEEVLNDLGFSLEKLDLRKDYYYTLNISKSRHCDLSLITKANVFDRVYLFPYEEWFYFDYVEDIQNLWELLNNKKLILKK